MSDTQFLVITGLSGSGKSMVHSCLEDMGYYCVDNLPLGLIERFFELIEETSREIHRVAVVTDLRERSFLTDFVKTYADLKSRYSVELLFLEASEEVLIQRFSETRRPHPLAGQATLVEALQSERSKLEPVRDLADYVVDTSRFNAHEVREYFKTKFGSPSGADALAVTIESFGFKHGIPRETDLLFDVRFLPNPYFVAELREKTGLDADVRKFVLEADETVELLDHLGRFLRFVLPKYVREGKSYLTISIGCTGGRHRSVAIATQLASDLGDMVHAINVKHRGLVGQ